MIRTTSRRRGLAALLALSVLVLGACGSDDGPDEDASGSGGSAPAGTTVRLLTHDSFAVSDEVLAAFEAETGITVEILKGGDAVTVVNQAILTAGNPQADVLFGVDNNTLPRALDEGLFEPYRPADLASVDEAFLLDPDGRATPVDYGDVCVNYDRAWFAERGLAVPETLDDLTDPAYRDLLVVQDPTTSSPGLAFLLASHAAFGDGADDWWSRLAANGVRIVDGWEQAYYDAFSGGSGQGDRPLVVSYASSPPAEVTDASLPPDQIPTGAVPATCYRQIEFAGVLAGTPNRAAAERLVDFLVSLPFQEDLPGQMYVYPVRPDATLPEVFARYTVAVPDPYLLDPAQVAANRDEWVSGWLTAVGG